MLEIGLGTCTWAIHYLLWNCYMLRCQRDEYDEAYKRERRGRTRLENAMKNITGEIKSPITILT
jgi:hypothetical protein